MATHEPEARLNGALIETGDNPSMVGLPPLRLPAHNWAWFAVRGVLAIVVGLAILALPGLALFVMAMLFAAFTLVDGVLSLISGLRGARHSQDRWWALILSGLLGIVVGGAILLFPLLGTVAYATAMILLVSGWAIFSGLLDAAAAWRMRREIEGEWLLGLSGVLSIVFGLGLFALLMIAPAPTLLTFAWMIGLYCLVIGGILLVLAFRLKRHGSER